MHFESIFSYHGRIDSGIDEHELLTVDNIEYETFCEKRVHKIVYFGNKMKNQK